MRTIVHNISQLNWARKTRSDEWKAANITAVYNKEDKASPGNYKLISLTSIICKLLESILCDHIVGYMKSNKLFDNKQYGFLKGRSTTMLLLKVMDEWSKILDEGNTVDVIYTDFSKAFDTVPHGRLLSKLSGYGIKGKVLQWIGEFLTGRRQRVMVMGEASSWEWVKSGVP